MVMNSPAGPRENKEHSSYYPITVRRKKAEVMPITSQLYFETLW